MDAVSSITEFLNDLEPDEQARIYICSEGGTTDARDVLLSMLNFHKEQITLVGYCELCSAAFELFFMFYGDCELVFGTTGMYHRATRQIRMSSSGRPKDKEQEYLLADLKTHAATTAEHIYELTKMHKSAISRINQDQDVYFEYEEMVYFLDNKKAFFDNLRKEN